MPQPSPHIPLLQLRPCQLLLLFRLELHVGIILGARVGGRRRRAADVAADVAGAGSGVFEAVERDRKVTFVRHPPVGNVPLLGAEGAHEFFVVGDPGPWVSLGSISKRLGILT